MVQLVAPKAWPADAEQRLSKVGCKIPFKHIEILSHGQVVLCCGTWLPQVCGNVLQDSPEEILNNAKRHEILENMRRGRYPHCTNHCPRLDEYLADSANHSALIPLDHLNAAVADSKFEIYFCYDHSCNLQCPSCRTGLILHRPDDTSNPEAMRLVKVHAAVMRLVDYLINLGHEVELNITGSGDPFASPLYWSYLCNLTDHKHIERFTFTLCTNGVLMSAANWERIRPLWPRIRCINVSIDAATEDTYKIVRKNGSWPKLLQNLTTLDELISRGDMPNLYTWQNNFIVQRDNFRELKQFVEWQLSYRSLTNIWTNLIAQWVHMSDEQYRSMAIWQDDHAQKDELLAMLRDPIFDEPRVYLGNMSLLRSQALGLS